MKKRKFIAVALALVMVVLMLPMAVSAADGATFAIDAPSGAIKAGDTFTVSVSLTGNEGFNALQFTLEYDKSLFQCTKASPGELLDDMISAANPRADEGAIIAVAGLDSVVTDGNIAVYTFKAVKDVTAPVFSLINIVYSENRVKKPYSVLAPSGEEQPPAAEDPAKPGDPTKPKDQDQPVIAPGDPKNFTDIATHWARMNIIRAAQMNLFSGYTDGRFGPDDNVTRGQFVTVLWRLSGRPEAAAAAPFRDISTQPTEFKKAIAWAYETKCVSGRSATTFDPEGLITREEAMSVLFRYSGGQSGMELMFTGVYDEAFSDSGDIGAWAKPALYWGVYHELVSGTSKTTLSPGGYASRAQLATILVKYIDTFEIEV